MSMTVLGPDHIARHLYHNDRVHVALESPDLVTDEQIRLYHEQGFLAVENVFTPAEIEGAKAGISWLIAGNAPGFRNENGAGVYVERGVDVSGMPPGEKEHYVRKIMWFVEHEPRLLAMSRNPKLVGLVERLLGTRVKLIQDMALLKPAHLGTEKPWHQDCAYFLNDPLEMLIGTWTALDAATPDNGCMHVIRGSHLKGSRPHYHDRDCQLPDEAVDVEQDVVVPLKPGGTLLFSGLLHHGTPPNLSSDRRRALQFHYAPPDGHQMTQQEHGKLFYDARGMASCASDKVQRNIGDKAS
jgi:phytanoyl-CoA hydroxylase